ncbi:SRPBCC family protein [Vannielia litorea]|uniref:Uncharacterized conserved protein YndB, AHSA1/START domain n=1 Tax=Vannielia litorea TaxID=1217970 RepID=A0A1N6H7E9_9RHOB|nr:SRPBCC domain-containing protein [Vannielia litorea]SIO15714.1 Uncharacterized conserved protein YndB, AHSA1/START domain [Vannielia litorea]
MRDLEFIRDYSVSLDRLWAAVTRADQLLLWMGHDGMETLDSTLEFHQTGPWFMRMRGLDSGAIFEMGGQVTSVSPPKDGWGQVALTWAWVSPREMAGSESHVTYTVEATPEGARLTLTHRELPTTEMAQRHSKGWLGTLQRLERLLANP